MRRRAFLKTVPAAFATPLLASETSSAKPSIPSINQTALNQHGWETADSKPVVPSFTEEDHQKMVRETEWGLNTFHGTKISDAVANATPLESVRPLQHIWAAHVKPSDKSEDLSWTGRETEEATAQIDGTTEAAYEKYIEGSILDGELDHVAEVHKKAAKQATTGVLGQIPVVGPLFSNAVSWGWTPKTSVTTATGDTAHISQYYFSIPVAALSPDAEDKVDEETSLDYRGIYIDWFTGNNEFYAAGAVYPQNRKHLNQRLSKAFDSGAMDVDLLGNTDYTLDTSKTYEQDILELLTKIK